MTNVVGEGRVSDIWAAQDKPSAPALRDQKLREGVDPHRSARQQMEDVPRALFLAQRVIARSHVEDDGVCRFRRLCRHHKIGRRQVGDYEAVFSE